MLKNYIKQKVIILMKLKKIIITICEACLNGEGSECHTPGCALCWHKVDLPIISDLYEVLEEWEGEEWT